MGKETLDANWYQINGGSYSIYKPLFKKGILVACSNHFLKEKKGNFQESQFKINDRTFHFTNRKDFTKSSKQSKKIEELKKAALNKAAQMLEQLQDFSNSNNSSGKLFVNKEMILCDKERREEVFLPLIVKNQESKFGLYVFPWAATATARENDFKFSGCQEIVSAGSIPGLIGIDGIGGYRPFIKDNIHFFPGQKFEHVELNQEGTHPYEQMLFAQLNKFSLFIVKLKKKKEQPQHLLYHMPIEDYILFGVDLYRKDRITLGAFGKFVKLLFQKREEHVKKITDIFSKHNISVTIDSPFKKIFDGSLDELNSSMAPAELAEAIFKKLGILNNNSDSQKVNVKEIEKEFMLFCLEKLTRPGGEKHHKVWQEFLDVTFNDELESLEELIKNTDNDEIKSKANADTGEEKKAKAKAENNINCLRAWKKFIETIFKVYELNKLNKSQIQKQTQDGNDERLDNGVWQTFIEIVSQGKGNILTRMIKYKARENYLAMLQLIIEVISRNGSIYIDNLFEIANAVMVGIGARDKKQNEVCSLLPVSKEKIQLDYAKYCKKFAKQIGVNSYSSVFNLTILDSMIISSRESDLAFYAYPSWMFAEFIEENKIIEKVYQNVSLFAQQGENDNDNEPPIVQSNIAYNYSFSAFWLPTPDSCRRVFKAVYDSVAQYLPQSLRFTR